VYLLHLNRDLTATLLSPFGLLGELPGYLIITIGFSFGYDLE
jgi:hypothetical protein